MAGAVISALVSAFITGALARLAVPGPDPMPIWLTVVIGLVGTLIGGGDRLRDRPAAIRRGSASAASSRRSRSSCLYRRFIQKRPILGPDAYRFPSEAFGVEQYRERLQQRRHRPRPDRVAVRSTPPLPRRRRRQRRTPSAVAADDPTENPAHYLRLLEELHDNGVLSDEEYDAARTRLSNGSARRKAMMLALIIFLAVCGLVVGALARLALPGPDPMGIFATIGLGLAGSFLGGLIAGLFSVTPAGFVFSVIGAILAALSRTAASCSTGR